MLLRFALAYILLLTPLAAQNDSRIHSIEVDGREVSYVIDGPYAVAQGDIIIGTATQVETLRVAHENGKSGALPQSLRQVFGAIGPQLWPNGIIYYTIDPSVTDTAPLLAGLAQWNSMTPLQVLPRTNQPDYVRFVTVTIDAACESYVGKVGGSQDIGITSECTAGSIAHELGHAFGLLHEQERGDRGGHVTVLYGNIDKRFYSNFYQSPSFSDTGYYDFGSIMHYPYYGFATNFQDTLETVPVGIPMGQRNRLSAGDIDGASRLYGFIPPSRPCLKVCPSLWMAWPPHRLRAITGTPAHTTPSKCLRWREPTRVTSSRTGPTREQSLTRSLHQRIRRHCAQTS
jgi:hypothetical protein